MESDTTDSESDSCSGSDSISLDLDYETDSEEADDQEDGRDEQSVVSWSKTLKEIAIKPFTGNVGFTFDFDASKRELDFFLMFFSRLLITTLVVETNRYASEVPAPNHRWIDTYFEEMCAFIGIHIILSLISIPTYTMAWNSSWIFSLPGVSKIMTRARFEQLSKYFHLTDNAKQIPRNQPGHSKLFQVQDFIHKIKSACLTNYDPPMEQSIDEGMVPFKGRLSFKQYIPIKPRKYGIKVWIRASPHNGYVHEFQIYTGKDGSTTTMGLGERVVMDLIEAILGLGHHIYTDSFFTSPHLLEKMLEKGTYGCGTVRTNRKGMPDAIKNKRLLKDEGESVILQKGPIVAVAWKDKRVVTFIASNTQPMESTTVPRKAKDGRVRQVKCPTIARNYGRFMNGVDRADQLRMTYPTGRKAKKWWKYIFWFLFDICLVNAFIAMKESDNHKLQTRNGRNKMRTQLQFRMALAEQLIGQFRGNRKRRASNADFGGDSHWPVWTEKKARCKRCLSQGVRHEVFVKCSFCKVHLCVDKDCFRLFHMKTTEE